jgi:hypothetical protein
VSPLNSNPNCENHTDLDAAAEPPGFDSILGIHVNRPLNIAGLTREKDPQSTAHNTQLQYQNTPRESSLIESIVVRPGIADHQFQSHNQPIKLKILAPTPRPLACPFPPKNNSSAMFLEPANVTTSTHTHPSISHSQRTNCHHKTAYPSFQREWR